MLADYGFITENEQLNLYITVYASTFFQAGFHRYVRIWEILSLPAPLKPVQIHNQNFYGMLHIRQA